MNCFIKIIILTAFVSALSGCEPKWNIGSTDFTPKIVVEGWIEDGQYPHVCLSQTKNLNTTIDSLGMFDLPIRWAKVTVSDGTDTEILTGRMNKNYTPPFIYTGNRIKGEVGKQYTLTVEYSGHRLTANTYIPEPVSLNNIIVEKCADSDTLFQLKAYFTDNRKQKNYYKFFTMALPEDKRFFSSFMGTFDDNILSDEEACISVYRGFRFTNYRKYSPFYKKRDTVFVKFTQLPEDGFIFWSSYENEVTNGKNPIFPSSSNLKSNIKGGYGIWCGYGATTYRVIIHHEKPRNQTKQKSKTVSP